MTGNQVQALLITGTVGVGKTSTLEAAACLLAADGVPHAAINLDDLRRAWPSPANDPFNLAVELQNLSAVAANYVAAGAHKLLLAGVVETPAQRRAYEQALGWPVVVSRLDADLEVVRRRLAHRHDSDEPSLRWHLHRVGELNTILRTANVEDFTVQIGNLSPLEVAREVLAAAGWGPSPSQTA